MHGRPAKGTRISSTPSQIEETTDTDVEQLRDRSLQSLQLAIELFNRPHECARPEAVLILLHHSFELILKSLVLARTGCVFDEQRGFSFSFDKCLRIAEEELQFVTKDHRKFLSMLDNLRDSAMHYYQEISEQVLYIFAQASISLFNDLIRIATSKGLLEFLPGRVLPISAIPPKQVACVLDDEFARLRQLLRQPQLSKQRAVAMLRPLMAFKVGGEDQHRRMTTAELEVALENLSAAENWQVVFPEIARIQFTSEGDGVPVGFKVVKNAPDAIPVCVLKPEEADQAQGVIIHREVNIFDKFNMGLYQLAKHVGVSAPRTLAMIREYGIEDDPECFRILKVRSQRIKGYSKKALDLLREKVDTVEEVWRKHRHSLTGRKRART